MSNSENAIFNVDQYLKFIAGDTSLALHKYKDHLSNWLLQYMTDMVNMGQDESHIRDTIVAINTIKDLSKPIKGWDKGLHTQGKNPAPYKHGKLKKYGLWHAHTVIGHADDFLHYNLNKRLIIILHNLGYKCPVGDEVESYSQDKIIKEIFKLEPSYDVNVLLSLPENVTRTNNSSSRNITGDWLIFKPYNNTNCFLYAKKHHNSHDNDDELADDVRTSCENQYPHLFK